MKFKHVMLGCGGVVLFVLVVLILISVFAWRGVFEHGVSTDLVDYKRAVQEMDIDDEIKSGILMDLSQIRLSLDKNNNFRFFQWITINSTLEELVADGNLSDEELFFLQTEIERMKKIQELL